MSALGGILALLAWLALTVLWLLERGYRRGFKEGYAQAHRDADNWWLRVQREMEEGERKMREAEGR